MITDDLLMILRKAEFYVDRDDGAAEFDCAIVVDTYDNGLNKTCRWNLTLGSGDLEEVVKAYMDHYKEHHL